MPITDLEPGKARWLAKGNPEDMPDKCDSDDHEGATLSPPVCLSTRTLFPPNKHFTCFTTFRLCENSLLHSWWARALSLVPGPWSLLVWWLGFSTLAAAARTQSQAGNRNPASSHCRLRPPEISTSQFYY